MFYNNEVQQLIKQELINNLEQNIKDVYLEPLSSKYYSTNIKIILSNGEEDVINIVTGNKKEPSDRELEKKGIKREQWDNNIEIFDYFGNYIPIKQMDLFEASHMESQFDYLLACFIINIIKEKIY